MKRLLLLLLLIPSPALAEDAVVKEAEKLGGTTYAPDYCEFTASFPAQAYVTRKCEDAEQKSCYDLVSFTKVFDMAATVQVDIICNPSTEAMFNQLTTEVMETTVKAMTKDSVIEAYNVSSRDGETFRHAGLLGKGRYGVQESIYIAQLWSGKKSMMSVEAQLIGEPIEAADDMFAEILRSIGPLPGTLEEPSEEKKEKETEPTDKEPAEEKSEN
jgi:hypothetical protein